MRSHGGYIFPSLLPSHYLWLEFVMGCGYLGSIFFGICHFWLEIMRFELKISFLHRQNSLPSLQRYVRRLPCQRKMAEKIGPKPQYSWSSHTRTATTVVRTIFVASALRGTSWTLGPFFSGTTWALHHARGLDL